MSESDYDDDAFDPIENCFGHYANQFLIAVPDNKEVE